ncbi:MAG: M23 family metallopeptidase [Anaerolineales bacterium]|jgi:murein DD-endopeptidase MepM/ murein hydrolase activator NlpD
MGKLSCEVYFDPKSNNIYIHDMDREDFAALRKFLIDLGKADSDENNVIPETFTWEMQEDDLPQPGAVFTWPTMKDWQVTQRFGENPENYPLTNGHEGIDIWAPGTQVYACMDGEVYSFGTQHAGTYTLSNGDPHPYGRHVRIRHADGIETIYAHFSRAVVRTGQKVTAGDLIGYMGSTGNSTGRHLHMTVKQNGVIRNPASYLGL